MDYPTFKKNLAHTGLTIRELADLLRMNRNSITNYAQLGEVPAHLGVIVNLIAALVDRKVDFRKALSGAQIKPKRKRGIPFGVPFQKMGPIRKAGKPIPSSKPIPAGQTGPSPAQRPRFWYPGDLTIPDAPVHQSIPIPEKAHQQGYHAQTVQERKDVKEVQIIRRGRRKSVEQADGEPAGERLGKS